MFPNIKIELEARQDKHENTFYIGRAQAPVILDLYDGFAIFVFTSEQNQEMLHLASPKHGSKFSSLKKQYHTDGSVERLTIPLVKKFDVEKRPYYMALFQDDEHEISLRNGAIFIVFTSKHGAEQIQIITNSKKEKPDVEVIGLDESGEEEFDEGDWRHCRSHRD